MAWARLDDRWHDHPKTIAAGLEAAGLFVMCLTWAHSSRRTSPSPGVVPDGVLVRLAGRKASKLAQTLHGVGFFDDKTDAGWPIHDFADYLPKYDPEQAREAGARGGKASAGKRTAKQTATPTAAESLENLEAVEVANGKQTSSTRASARRNPVPVPNNLPPTAGDADAPPGDPESHEQRVNRVTKTYTEAVPLSNFVAIRAIVSKALRADYSEDRLIDALSRMADDNRTVTTDSLRIELDGLPPSRYDKTPSGRGIWEAS